VSDVLDTIDSTLEGRCACGCDQKLDPDGASSWFAGQDCQMRYLQAQAIRPHEIVAPPRPALVQLPLLSGRIRNAEDIAEAERRLREAIDLIHAHMPTMWDRLKPVIDAVMASLRRLAETLMPVLHGLAPIVAAHLAYRRRVHTARLAYRRHLHTAYHRRLRARRRKARR